MMQRNPYVRSFTDPDDVIELEGLRSEIVSLGDVAVAHDVHQPGWRWSVDVGPVVGTEWCPGRHVGYAVAGRVHVVLDTGVEYDIAEGDVFEIPPGHDAWVVGDQPFDNISWVGVRNWIPALESLTERVLATLVFTDIVDSTGVASRLGDRAWSELIATQEARVRDTLARFRGREVKTTGDGVLATFDGAARAIRCATVLRDVAAGLGLSIRAAIHTGEVEVGGSDLRGLAVHEAARILGLAGPGEILVSATTHGLVGDAGFQFDDRGEHALRGIPGVRRVYAHRG
jgi:class 3 adenylate cyclase